MIIKLTKDQKELIINSKELFKRLNDDPHPEFECLNKLIEDGEYSSTERTTDGVFKLTDSNYTTDRELLNSWREYYIEQR